MCHRLSKEPGFFLLTEEEATLFRNHNIKVVKVPWMLPKEISNGVGGCGPTDLMRLHVFNQTQYDAVIYYDGDVQIMGDIMPLFRCAATGEFMMTEGAGAPLNAGFMALRPSKAMFEMSLWYASKAIFTRNLPDLLKYEGTVRVFQHKFTLEDTIGSHACSRAKLVHACDQWHTSRVSTPLTGLPCKSRPNTEGGWDNGSARPSKYGTWAGFECGYGALPSLSANTPLATNLNTASGLASSAGTVLFPPYQPTPPWQPI
jgi:hypothetical protein